MKTRALLICGLFLLLLPALAGPVSAAGSIQTYLGNVVPLSGYAYGGPYVYLFLTGPNLPVNGVALDNIYNRADQGLATRVNVDSDGRWEYKWGTGSINGRLDAGAYTVWVADGPADRSNLRAVEYSTITIDLSKPYLSIGGPSRQDPPGSMDVQSDPPGASVVVDGTYRGMTPVTVDSLDPGTHNVTLSKSGYAKLSTLVPIESASISEVNATLVFDVGAIAINTTPAGAAIVLDGAGAGFSPEIIGNLTPGNHTLVISKDGFVSKTLEVQVMGGLPTFTAISLEPVSSGPSIPLPLPTRAAGLVPATVAGLIVTALVASAGIRKK